MFQSAVSRNPIVELQALSSVGEDLGERLWQGDLQEALSILVAYAVAGVPSKHL